MSKPGPAPERARRDLRAHDLEQLLEGRIRAGEYAQGARLPTVRELAEHYHINKNTAARAYQGLERRGLIDVWRGRGAFVRPQPANGTTWQHRAAQLVAEAQQLGLSRTHLLVAVAELVGDAYGREAPRVLFVECNRQDLEALGGELSSIMGLAMELALLDEALQLAGTLAERYDLLVTTFQHLGQMRQAAPANARERVIGVLATPTHDSLLELARLHVDTFGLVCDTPTTIESLSHIISTYNPSARVVPGLIDDATQLRRVLDHADAIVVTRSCRERLVALGLDQPIVTVVFTIDQQSIDFLRRRIHELRQLRPAPPG